MLRDWKHTVRKTMEANTPYDGKGYLLQLARHSAFRLFELERQGLLPEHMSAAC